MAHPFPKGGNFAILMNLTTGAQTLSWPSHSPTIILDSKLELLVYIVLNYTRVVQYGEI